MTNEEFFLQLYDEHFEKLLRYASRRFEAYLAEDLVSETFLEAWHKIRKVRAHENPKLWLFRTLSNKCKHQTERKSYQMEVELDESDFPDPATLGGASIMGLLPRDLAPSDTRYLTMRFEKKMDYQSIAEELGVSEDAARRNVARAVVRCRKGLLRGSPITQPE